MVIRNYRKTDEKEWLKCRVLSFFDCSYYDDIVRKKPTYQNETIDLVAEEKGTIIGFIEVEIEKKIKDVCYLHGELGGVIWNLGVLPEYRNKNIATLLLEETKKIAITKNITRFEAWTQDDVSANNWYIGRGFKYIEGYLNVYASGKQCKENNLINKDESTNSIRSLNFETTLDRKTEMEQKYYRVHEVRLYQLELNK
ncbi:N-acetyltransferase [Vallitalea longa]|uniref:N-acetyltransferase n=1 Tax=Vallitalea longa TaxID=2936439 RepID=A0A9W5YC18_9FIRM|nr:GNAT family N-acetyltransferase [Vallitalea longa]GKX29184.1 N-acetyltransferase [Vallitalea longa]